MSDVTFYQDDTGPSLSGTLANSDGTPVNLASATVRFQMRRTDDLRYTVDAPAAIVSAGAGTVRYDWADGDLATAGEYVSVWQITYSGGPVIHSATNTITVDPA